jgi:hypothetical protein
MKRIFDSLAFPETIPQESRMLAEDYLNAVFAFQKLFQKGAAVIQPKTLSEFSQKLSEATREAREKDYSHAAKILWDTFGSAMGVISPLENSLRDQFGLYRAYAARAVVDSIPAVPDEFFENWSRSGFQEYLETHSTTVKDQTPVSEFVHTGRAVMETFARLQKSEEYPGSTRTFIWNAFTDYHRFAEGSIQRLVIKRLLEKVARCFSVECFDFRVFEYSTRLDQIFSPQSSSLMDRLSQLLAESAKLPPTDPSPSDSFKSWYEWYKYVVVAVGRLIEECSVETVTDSGTVIRGLIETLESTRNPTDATIFESGRRIWGKFADIVKNSELLLESKFREELNHYKNALVPVWQEHDRQQKLHQSADMVEAAEVKTTSHSRPVLDGKETSL